MRDVHHIGCHGFAVIVAKVRALADSVQATSADLADATCLNAVLPSAVELSCSRIYPSNKAFWCQEGRQRAIVAEEAIMLPHTDAFDEVFART